MRRSSSALLLIATILSAPAMANNFYAGAAAGYTKISDSAIDNLKNIGASVDDESAAFKINAGYNFTENLAAEVFYIDPAKYNIGASGAGGSASGSIDLSGWGLAGLVKVPVTPALDLYGKLGIWRWNSKESVSGTINNVPISIGASTSGSDPVFGAGASYTIYQNIKMVTEYELFKGDGSDLHVVSVGLNYNF